MAFVFLNRYLDIVEAIDGEDTSTIDNVNFEISDIPQDFPIPERHFLEGTSITVAFVDAICFFTSKCALHHLYAEVDRILWFCRQAKRGGP